MSDLEERLRQLFREDAARVRVTRVANRGARGTDVARLLIAGLGSAAIIVLAAAAGQFLLAYRSGTSTALGSPTPSPSATPARCEVLAHLAPAPVPPLTSTDAGNGMKRVTSAEGGWSLEVPASWFVNPGFLGGLALGQAAITSYELKGLDYSGMIGPNMLPASTGVRLHVELWSNPSRDAPEQFAPSVRIGGDQTTLVDGAAVVLGGQRAFRVVLEEERRQEREPGGPIVAMRQSRALWVVPSLRPDRMLVIYAWPRENALITSAERIVSTLVLTQPVPPRMPVLAQRDEIVRRWLFDEKTGEPIPGRRAEAKLVTYAEANGAMGAGALPGGGRIDRDPEELFWVVAVSGDGLPTGRGSLLATASPTRWLLYITPATNDRMEMTGAAFGAQGDWPPFFDALADRCH